MHRRITRIVLPFACIPSLIAGCATTSQTPPIEARISHTVLTKSATEPTNLLTSNSILTVSAEEPSRQTDPGKMKSESTRIRPAYAQLETFPIDLQTVIRLVNENSPALGLARASIRAAEARLTSAEIQWLPNLSMGVTYNRVDGQTQNQSGNVFGLSRANLAGSVGPALSLDLADAIYRPLIERQMASAEQLRSQAVLLGAEGEGVAAYIDLVQVYALLEINADTLQKAIAMLTAAMNAKEAKLDRTAGDINRAQTEVLFRKAERIELEGKIGIASARLGRLLLLPPNVKLVPNDIAVVPVTLIDPQSTLDHLVELAINNRPDLKAHRELIAAAWARVRRNEKGPLLPKIIVTNQTGGFGGGLNDDLANFSARNSLGVQLYWEVRNLGFGNRADAEFSRAAVDQSQYQLVESQARISSEIVEAAQIAAARYESLDLAERAVKEATELYRINKEGTFNVLDAKNLFDALRPLQAIQLLNQARTNYLSAVLDFNRAQYRLFTLIGYPPHMAEK